MTNKANPPIASLSGLGLPPPLLTFLNQLWVRTGGNVDIISDIEVSQTTEDGGNRTYRKNQDELADLESRLVQVRKQNKLLEQMVYELMNTVGNSKNKNRQLEQKLNEIIERFDSGA